VRTKYSLAKLRRRRDKIRKLCLPNEGLPLSDLGLLRIPLLHLISEGLPDVYRVLYNDDMLSGSPEEDELREKVDRMYQAVTSCLDAFPGVTGAATREALTLDRILDLSYLMAGWWDKVIQGVKYVPWTPSRTTWALVRITDLYPASDKPGYYRVHFRCEAGAPVMVRWSSLLSEGWLRFLGRSTGFRKYDSLNLAEDVSGFYFAAVLGADKRGGITIAQPETDSSLLTHNRKLADRRTGKCVGPANKEVCGICRYGRDVCELGRWAFSYTVRKKCRNGHEGLFRKDIVTGRCLSCLYKRSRSK